MSHRGYRPPSQPRTVRTQAEDIGTSAAGFGGEVPYDGPAGIPVGTPGAGGVYEDQAEQARPPAGTGVRQRGPADPTPY